MRKMNPNNLQPGMIAAEPIFSPDGRKTLLSAGSPLTDKIIQIICNWEIPFVMVAEENETQFPDEPARDNEALAVLPEIMANRTLTFASKLEEAISQIITMLDDARDNGKVDAALIRDISATITKHLIQPSEAINRLLFRPSSQLDRDYLAHHSVAVAAMSGLLASWMELSPADIRDVVTAGLLHDVGKTKMLRSLAADSSSSRERQEMIKQHISFAVKMLSEIPSLPPAVLKAVAEHHECRDGSGYPRALSGDSIHPYAHIVAVADRLCHIAGDSAGLNPFTLPETLKSEMFTKLDPAVCDTFIRRINDYLMNNPVKLSDGRRAKVVFLPSVNPTSPVLKTDDEKFIDLTKNKEIAIVGIAF